MAKFVLSKGTVVKHGTTLPRAEAILSEGFIRGDRDAVRQAHELAPEQQGLYVGELISYFGAWAAYTAELLPMWKTNPAALAAYDAIRDKRPKALKKMSLGSVADTLPAVLVIELGADCPLYADEDFVRDPRYPGGHTIPDAILQDRAQDVWEDWKSGCLQTPIEPSWITRIELPSLSRLSTLNRGIDNAVRSDCELFCAGLLQSARKQQPGAILDRFEEITGRRRLSKEVPATAEALAGVRTSSRFADPAGKLANHAALCMTVKLLAAQYQIPLHR